MKDDLFFKNMPDGMGIRARHAEIRALLNLKNQPEAPKISISKSVKPSNLDLAEFSEFCAILCGVIQFLAELDNRLIIAQQSQQEVKQKTTEEPNLTTNEVNPIQVANSVKEKFYTIAQVMEVFQISRNTIYKWKKSGFLAPIKIGGRVLYEKGNVIEILNKSKV
jgi:DNA-binding transcriptional MerR regulator